MATKKAKIDEPKSLSKEDLAAIQAANADKQDRIAACIKKCHSAVMSVGYNHPHFLMIHQKINHMYVATDRLSTMAVTSRGQILFNIEFVEAQTKEHLGGALCHEMLHLVLMHLDRLGVKDMQLWNVATDMAINEALRRDGIALPDQILYPPPEYRGNLVADEIYQWIKNNPKSMEGPGKGGDGTFGRGCMVIPMEGQGEGEGQGDGDGEGEGGEGDSQFWARTAIEARATCASVGRGSSAVSTLLTPRPPKIDWKRVLRTGFQMANSTPTRDWQTFARRSRRSPEDGVQFAGWMGTEPKVAVIVDVSGSMDRKWLDVIASEIKNMMKRFNGTGAYLCVHTSVVEWSGWMKSTSDEKLSKALSFSGGTDPAPAYEDVRAAGYFDVIVHFTDCEFHTWPKPSAKKLVVGAFGRGSSWEAYAKPPQGSVLIPCVFE
jgi:Putative metallopeptidase domain/VWA-like domain (DUF2201)